MDEGASKRFYVGAWVIKGGRESEFISAWTDLAHWTQEQGKGVGEVRLVQDLEDPRRFYAIWEWGTEDDVSKWRASTRYKEFIMRMRAFCEVCQPTIGRAVVTVSPPGRP